MPAGIKFLVDMRADLLDVIRSAPAGAAALRTLSNSIRSIPCHMYRFHELTAVAHVNAAFVWC